MSNAVRRLISDLAAFRGSPDLLNHYSENDPRLDLPNGAEIRRKNLQHYLEYFEKHTPALIILGEAPGYRGCRFSGMVFTSEHTILNNSFFTSGGFEKSSCKETPWREASASIVWETMDKFEEKALLWATLPFHPHRSGAPLSNRTPTRREQAEGFEFFLKLRRIFLEPRIVAAGKIASVALTTARIEHFAVRHPSHGGKNDFQAGVASALRALRKAASNK